MKNINLGKEWELGWITKGWMTMDGWMHEWMNEWIGLSR